MKKPFLAAIVTIASIAIIVSVAYSGSLSGLGAQVFPLRTNNVKPVPSRTFEVSEDGSRSTCALTIEALPVPASQAIVIPTNGFDFAHIKFSAPSDCGITLQKISVGATFVSPSMIPSVIKNVKVTNLATNTQFGSTVVTPTVNPSANYYSADDVVMGTNIPAGTSLTVAIKADVFGYRGGIMRMGISKAEAVKTGTLATAGSTDPYWGQNMTFVAPVAACDSYQHVAKWGTPGSGNGQLSPTGPQEIALDSAGNVYVTDSGNHRTQKFTSSGAYASQWGSYGTSSGQFDYPTGIAIDASNNVYVADTNNFKIQKFTSSGTFLAEWGTIYADGTRYRPKGLDVDAAGNAYVVDSVGKIISKYASDGTRILQWNVTGGNGVLDPSHVTVDPSGTTVYVTNSNSNMIQKFTSSGSFVSQWGTTGSGNGQLNFPTGLALDSAGYVYLADDMNSRVQKFTAGGAYVTKWGSNGTSPGQFVFPLDVDVDSQGNVYVISRNTIQKFAPTCTRT